MKDVAGREDMTAVEGMMMTAVEGIGIGIRYKS